MTFILGEEIIIDVNLLVLTGFWCRWDVNPSFLAKNDENWVIFASLTIFSDFVNFFDFGLLPALHGLP